MTSELLTEEGPLSPVAPSTPVIPQDLMSTDPDLSYLSTTFTRKRKTLSAQQVAELELDADQKAVQESIAVRLTSHASNNGPKRPRIRSQLTCTLDAENMLVKTQEGSDSEGGLETRSRSRSSSSSSSNTGSNASTWSRASTPPMASFTSHETSLTPSKPKSYVCLISGCGKSYTKPSRLLEHERVHTDERPYRCPQARCSATFKREDHLGVHLRSHDVIRAFQCIQPGCDKAYYTKDKLMRHLKTHDEIVDLSTSITSTSTLSPAPSPSLLSSKSALLSNLLSTASIEQNSRDNEDQKKCLDGDVTIEELQQSLLDQERLQRLAEEIKQEKPYACTWGGCLKRFNKHKKLKAHVCMVHEGRKPYPCTHEGCQMSFQTPSKLQKHQLVHNNTRRYACGYPGCDVVFTKWSQLQKHNKTDHKSLPCTVCGAVLLKTTIKSHMKTHDTNRPVVPCTFEGCTKVFSTTRTLATHIKTIHEKVAGAPRFQCDFVDCGMGFEFKHVLERHIERIHTSPQPRKRRSDAIHATALDQLVGYTEDDAEENLPFACTVPGCLRRYSKERFLRRHLYSNAHRHKGQEEEGQKTGPEIVEEMDQIENQSIRDMMDMHLADI